jgi:uncharacterized SAM-binding protein YcdF (DUF218 family)
MEQFVTRSLESLILPPGFFMVLLVVAILLLNKKPMLGKTLLVFGLGIFYLLSTPLVSSHLISLVETHTALDISKLRDSEAGAIVILSSGRERNAPEYGSDTAGQHTLLRCRYGAFLQRKTGLPILVSGGRVFDKEGKSLAQVMAELLHDEFQAGDVWLEDKSLTTGQNAFLSKAFLAEKQIDTIYLVTQAWHMPRAVAVFRKAGFNVIPAPTAFEGGKPFKWLDVLPGARALFISRLAFRELAAALWYKIRY